MHRITIDLARCRMPCAVCESHAPGLRDIIIRQGGRYVIGEWAYREHAMQIEAIVDGCPVGAFEVGE